jgi:hypothetical protein
MSLKDKKTSYFVVPLVIQRRVSGLVSEIKTRFKNQYAPGLAAYVAIWDASVGPIEPLKKPMPPVFTRIAVSVFDALEPLLVLPP